MAQAYIKDEKKLLPAAALLSGEYGYKGLYIGVPCVLGAGGVEKIVEIELSDDEKAALDVSAGKVKDLLEQLP